MPEYYGRTPTPWNQPNLAGAAPSTQDPYGGSTYDPANVSNEWSAARSAGAAAQGSIGGPIERGGPQRMQGAEGQLWQGINQQQQAMAAQANRRGYNPAMARAANYAGGELESRGWGMADMLRAQQEQQRQAMLQQFLQGQSQHAMGGLESEYNNASGLFQQKAFADEQRDKLDQDAKQQMIQGGVAMAQAVSHSDARAKKEAFLAGAKAQDELIRSTMHNQKRSIAEVLGADRTIGEGDLPTVVTPYGRTEMRPNMTMGEYAIARDRVHGPLPAMVPPEALAPRSTLRGTPEWEAKMRRLNAQPGPRSVLKDWLGLEHWQMPETPVDKSYSPDPVRFVRELPGPRSALEKLLGLSPRPSTPVDRGPPPSVLRPLQVVQVEPPQRPSRVVGDFAPDYLPSGYTGYLSPNRDSQGYPAEDPASEGLPVFGRFARGVGTGR